MAKTSEPKIRDLESGPDDVHLYNDRISTISWKSINVHLYDKSTKTEKHLLQDIAGDAQAGKALIKSRHTPYHQSALLTSIGELVAIMGPSGSGKSTLLNILARRPVAPKATIEGDTYLNGTPASLATFRQVSCYVEQEDSLIGSLTSLETIDFAARLSLPRWAALAATYFI